MRTFVFWLHLAAGAIAALVILVMSLTGVLLTYERQLIMWADSSYQSVVPAEGARRAPVDAVLKAVQAAHADVEPSSVTIAADPLRPVTVAAGQRTFYADAYSGAFLGEASTSMRRFMTGLRSWHRWLAVEGQQRSVARAVTGWSNLLFAFLVASGVYLWLPRVWTWTKVRPVLLFNPRATGKARDFNWHHVIGIWSFVPLLIVVVSALPISFPWANAAIYQAVGEPVPAGRGGGPGGERGRSGEQPEGGRRGRDRRAPEGQQVPTRAGVEGEAARGERGGERGASERQPGASAWEGLDALLTRAEGQEPGWKTITLRLPASPVAPVAFAIDRGDGGQPHLRSTLTLARETGEFQTYETFASQTLGRRIRTTMRFAHTGEVLGLPGQTVAGLVSAGALVLVWTGLALTLRRFRNWIGRRSRRPVVAPAPAADSAA